LKLHITIILLALFAATSLFAQAVDTDVVASETTDVAVDTDALTVDTDAVQSKANEDDDIINWSDTSSETPADSKDSGASSMWAVMGNLIMAMIIVVGAVVGGVIVIQKVGQRKMGNGIKGKALRIVDRQAIGPKKSVCLLNACGRYLVLGVADKEITVLAEVELPDDDGDAKDAPKDFAASLNQAQQDEAGDA
jgi:flagellar biogenesis protein FliO